MVADGGVRGASDEDPYSITYDVPLYDQGKYRLCWAYCQLMIKSFYQGEELEPELAEDAAIEIAKKYHGDKDWNKGLSPSKIGKKAKIDSIIDLYWLLCNKGPLYAYYCNDNSAHLVVVTGVNIKTGTVYTNNPWNVPGIQSYSDFLNGFVGLEGETVDGYDFAGIYVPKR